MNKDKLELTIEYLELVNDDEITRPETRERNESLIKFYKEQLKEL